ncbi:MAG: hypothetical protein DRP71_15060, partial [Verrucomicrobia bacterium]
MKFRAILIIFGVIGIMALATVAAMAGGPVASPEGVLQGERGEIPFVTDKAFGDPTDFKAAALAGANYVRYMQADFTEDNAGNGFTDADPDNGGFGWQTTAFENTGATYGNVWGITINGLYQVYLLEPSTPLYIAMRDAANGLAASLPSDVTSAPNITYLLNFSNLPEVIAGSDPLALSSAAYKAAAVAIWDYDLDSRPASGNTSIYAFGQAIIEGRLPGLPNGIVAWDMALWTDALMELHGNYPAGGYDALADSLADVSFIDSFPVVPGDGIFEPDGHNKGFTLDYSNVEFEMYTIGVAGLIRNFSRTGSHTDKLPLLQTLLLECQYPDGAFSYQYGATPDINDRGYQDTAYPVWALYFTTNSTAATNQAFYDAATWLGAVQENTGLAETSGGFLYSDTTHIPEVGSECTAALAYAAIAINPSLNTTAPGPDPAQCGVTKTVTFDYDRGDATPGLYGYEVVVQITGPVNTVVEGDFSVLTSMDYFQVVDNTGGQFTVNGSRFGTDPGILADANLFDVDLVTSGDGTVDISIVSYRFRDPDNVFIFADMNGMDFVVDCTAPGPVADITAAPRHNKVDVTWTHGGIDNATYEIFRGLWYDTTIGVSAYPEYDDLTGSTIPTRPANYAGALASGEWVHAGSVGVGTLNFTDTWGDATSRGVYYYEVFAVDAALNGSVAAAANDRATNYWLGDVPPYIDGYVKANDITVLGACFATSQGDGLYNNMCDVGATDDWSRVGIPLTDSIIDFEDLMVFSMNYSVVTDAKTAPQISQTIELAWVQKDDGRWALHLVGGTGLKGVHVRSAVAVTSVTEGDLLASQAEMTFLVNTGDAMDVNLALMGRDLGFVGTGELFVIEAGAAVSPKELSIDLRGTDNSKLDYTLDKISGADTPKIFNLGANYPNPFNPMTKINFSLPEAQDVMLAVYSLDGRKVATLLNETRGAGPHEVVWMGRNDAGQAVASGTYFYRIDAGPYSQVRKMT